MLLSCDCVANLGLLGPRALRTLWRLRGSVFPPLIPLCSGASWGTSPPCYPHNASFARKTKTRKNKWKTKFRTL
eukprot:197661-Amphidinium_carterae.1